MDKMREEFEAWVVSEFDYDVSKSSNGTYHELKAFIAWESWKASRAALRVELDEIRSKIKSECEKSDYMKSVCRQIIDDIDSIQIERF